MDTYENNMSMHKNIQDANLQHNSAKVQSIQQKDMVRDQISLYLEHTNHALAYLQTELKKDGIPSKSIVPSSDGPEEGKDIQTKPQQTKEI